MSEILYMEHNNFHTKHSVFTAPDAHMHTSHTHSCMSIHTADKAAEYLINSCD